MNMLYHNYFELVFTMSTGEVLDMPHYFEGNANVYLILKMKMVNTRFETIKVQPRILIYHGLFLPYKTKFIEKLNVEIKAPLRAEQGTQKFFAIVLSQMILEQTTLPFNLESPPNVYIDIMNKDQYVVQ